MAAGEVIRGNASNQYELLARLAQGGMAEIFLARANGLAGFERYVVLKRIRPERDDDPRWVTMFLDEARLAAQLQHPNVAQVFDLGQISDAYFYTMEYVHGEDVLDILTRTVALGKRVPLHITLAIIAGAATGLAYAHDRVGVDGQPLGIVHRDISPANLMVSFDGTVKVLDFGVAKARSRETKTEAGTIMGKVAYLSPEQCQTNNVDHRSDLFSLGIVLYEMITHVRPFKRGNDYETLSAIVRFDPPAPSTVVRGLPPGTDEVVMRALAKDPAARFQSANEMLEAIEELADRANASLAPRDLKRFLRDMYGTPPEPWRTLGGDEKMGTFSGEVIGPLPTETRIRAFPADASALDVPLLAAKISVAGTPGALHGGTMEIDEIFSPTYKPVPSRLPSDDVPAMPVRVPPTTTAPPPTIRRATVPPPLHPDRPSGTIEVIAPAGTSDVHEPSNDVLASAAAAVSSLPLVAPKPVAPLAMFEPTQAITAKRRSLVIVTLTVLALVGVGVGTMFAFGGEEPRAPTVIARPPPPSLTPPSVTPIDEPAVAAEPAGTPRAEEPVPTKPVPQDPAPTPAAASSAEPKPLRPKPKKPPTTETCPDPLDCQH